MMKRMSTQGLEGLAVKNAISPAKDIPTIILRDRPISANDLSTGSDKITLGSSAAIKQMACRHFINGNCTYGDRCRFRHDIKERTDPYICRHFAFGRCCFKNCRFKHIGPGGVQKTTNEQLLRFSPERPVLTAGMSGIAQPEAGGYYSVDGNEVTPIIITPTLATGPGFPQGQISQNDLQKLQLQALSRVNLNKYQSTSPTTYPGLVTSPTQFRSAGAGHFPNLSIPLPSPIDIDHDNTFSNTPVVSPSNVNVNAFEHVQNATPVSQDFLPSNLLYTDMVPISTPTENDVSNPISNMNLQSLAQQKEQKQKNLNLFMQNQRAALAAQQSRQMMPMQMATQAQMPGLTFASPTNLSSPQTAVLSPTNLSNPPTAAGAGPGSKDYERAWNGYDKKDVCRHWLKGKCTFGNNCVFAHELRVTSYTVDVLTNVKEEDICRHFLLGRCTYGKSCSFLHAMRQNNGFTQTYSPY